MRATSTREFAPSLEKMFRTCVSTVRAEEELLGDLAVGLPVDDLAGDLRFTAGKRSDTRSG